MVIAYERWSLKQEWSHREVQVVIVKLIIIKPCTVVVKTLANENKQHIEPNTT